MIINRGKLIINQRKVKIIIFKRDIDLILTHQDNSTLERESVSTFFRYNPFKHLKLNMYKQACTRFV